jgi:hypothetical protein
VDAGHQLKNLEEETKNSGVNGISGREELEEREVV